MRILCYCDRPPQGSGFLQDKFLSLTRLSLLNDVYLGVLLHVPLVGRGLRTYISFHFDSTGLGGASESCERFMQMAVQSS